MSDNVILDRAVFMMIQMPVNRILCTNSQVGCPICIIPIFMTGIFEYYRLAYEHNLLMNQRSDLTIPID